MSITALIQVQSSLTFRHGPYSKDMDNTNGMRENNWNRKNDMLEIRFVVYWGWTSATYDVGTSMMCGTSVLSLLRKPEIEHLAVPPAPERKNIVNMWTLAAWRTYGLPRDPTTARLTYIYALNLCWCWCKLGIDHMSVRHTRVDSLTEEVSLNSVCSKDYSWNKKTVLKGSKGRQKHYCQRGSPKEILQMNQWFEHGMSSMSMFNCKTIHYKKK